MLSEYVVLVNLINYKFPGRHADAFRFLGGIAADGTDVTLESKAYYHTGFYLVE